MHTLIPIHAGNRQALQAADAACLEPGNQPNPLMFYGPAGTGKTDILHAIGKKIRMLHPELKIQYLAGGCFSYTDWKHLPNQFDVILLDEADELIKAPDGALTLLDLITKMTAQRKAIVIASAQPVFRQSIEQIPGLQQAAQIELQIEPWSSGLSDITGSIGQYPANRNGRNLNQAWESVIARFRSKVTDDSYHQWFSSVEPHFSGDKVTLHLPGEIHHDTNMLRYRSMVEQELRELLGIDAPVIEWATRRTSTN